MEALHAERVITHQGSLPARRRVNPTRRTFNSYEGAAALATSIVGHFAAVTTAVSNNKTQDLQDGNSILEREFVFFSVIKLVLIPEPVDVKFRRSFNRALQTCRDALFPCELWLHFLDKGGGFWKRF